MKNKMGKTRPFEAPYLIFEGGPFGETRVLKSWQGDNAKPFARFFVAVNGDLGDTYVASIVKHERLAFVDATLFETDEERAAFMHNLNEARKTDNGGW